MHVKGKQNKMKKFIIKKFITLLLFAPLTAFSTGAGITYNGRLLDPNGNAVVSNNVQFRIQIRTPGNENCLLYEEIQSKDMTNSDGIFSITINDGTGVRIDSTALTLEQIFANHGSISFPGGYCVSGSSYSPNPADGRKLQVYFNDGSFATGQWEPTPAMAINFIPMAIESQQVGGYKKEQILKLADGVTTTGSELDATKWTSLQALINGTSTAYVKPTDQVTQLYGAAIPTPSNGQSIRWNSSLNAGSGGWENFTAGASTSVTNVTAGTGLNVGAGPGGSITTTGTLNVNVGTAANQVVQLDGAAKLPAVDGSQLTNVDASKLSGTALSITSISNGQVLKYNGSNWVNSTLTDNDTLGGLSCSNGRVAYYTGGAWSCLEVTSANTANTLVSRDGSGVSTFGTVSAGVANLSSLKISNGANDVTLSAPATFSNYSLKLPTSVGTAGQVLITDGASPANLSWSTLPAGTVTTVSSANADISVATGSSTPVLTLNSGTGANQIVKLDGSSKLPAVDGSQLTGITATQIGSGVLPIARGGTNSGTALSGNRLIISNATQIVESTAMTDGQVIVGKTGFAPQLVSMTGDATISNTGSVTVAKIQNRTVASTVPSLGSFLKWNNTLSQWEPNVLSSCLGSDQVMHYNSITDSWTCDYIGLSSNVTGTLGIANGGTGATTANAALNALMPSQTGNSGKFLTTNGTNTSWGTLTSSQWTTTGSDIYYSTGKVGIGTSTPLTFLDLIGSLNDSANGYHYNLILRDPAAAAQNVGGGIAFSGNADTQRTFAVIQGGHESSTASSYDGFLRFSTRSNGSTSITEKMRISSAGNVGIGVTNPVSTLDVNGAIKSTSISNAGASIDFSTGNLQYTSISCGAVTLNNLKSGGTYSLAIQGTAGGTCSFTAYSGNGTGALTLKTGTVNLTQTSNKHIIFTFMVMGSFVYVASIDEY